MFKKLTKLFCKSSYAKSNDEYEYVNFNEDDQMEIYGYQRRWIKTFVTWIFIILSASILRLIFYWRSHWMLYCTHRRCPQMDADTVLLIDKYDQIFTEKVVLRKSSKNHKKNETDLEFMIPKYNAKFESTASLRYFDNKKIRYLWNYDTLEFEKLYGLDRNVLCSAFYQQNGLTAEEQIKRTDLFGENKIKIKVQSILEILFYEVLGPFYIFQFVAIILWSLDEYYYYASFILLMSIVSLLSSAFQIRRNQRQLRDAVKGSDIVEVCRSGETYEKMETSKLVPGDVIILPSHAFELQCDAVLLSGNIIVDESMLTGESVPVTKTPIPSTDNPYNPKHHFKHILFSGTKAIQTRYYGEGKVKAVVIRTGFQTTKGELVRSIMFPKPIDFKFNRHIHIFIFIMACIAMTGFIYTIIIKIRRNDPIGDIFVKALDLVTIVVPPELPAALTIATIFVDNRLRKSNIYCISPRSINISGCIDCLCFDKTGTLTEDDLSFAEVLPTSSKTNEFETPLTSVDTLELSPLLVCLASCHELTIIDGNIVGDPLDIKMFETTKWVLEEPEVNDSNKYDLLAPSIVKPSYVKGSTDKPQVGILRTFPFSSNLSRMSVITRLLDANQFVLYVKGAPEVVQTLCDPNTIPKNFNQMLSEYTKKSYRVLSVAYRSLPNMSYKKVQRDQREDLETNLTFLGFVVMRNMLKAGTIETIKSLHSANIRTLMATGDNIMTGLSVAQECQMIGKNDKIIIIEADDNIEGIPHLKWKFTETSKDNATKECSKQMSDNFVNLSIDERVHIAITGQTFKIIKEYYPNLLPKLAVHGTVFARMSPEQKQLLIENLQEVGYYVGMCGDGANDCGALKAAHAGVSLSDTEASVASPFTSKTNNISCVITLIREGRSSLVSVFGIIKYMACYNITAFTAIIILYTLESNLTDIQNLYQDLFIISLYVTLFARTHPYEELSRTRPPMSLIGLTQLSSIVLQLAIVIMFQVGAVFLLWQQSWYQKIEAVDEYDYACHDNYAVFAIQVFQYISLVITFSKGAPFRKPFYTNILFLIAIIITTITTLYIVIIPNEPSEWVADFFELEYNGFTYEFRFILVGLALCHFIIALILERYIVEKLIGQILVGTSKETKYKKIAKESRNNEWLNSTTCTKYQTT